MGNYWGGDSWSGWGGKSWDDDWHKKTKKTKCDGCGCDDCGCRSRHCHSCSCKHGWDD